MPECLACDEPRDPLGLVVIVRANGQRVGVIVREIPDWLLQHAAVYCSRLPMLVNAASRYASLIRPLT